MISRNLQDLFISHDGEYIQSLAHILSSSFESNWVLDHIYVDTLVSIGERYTFGQETVLLMSKLVYLLK